MLTSNLARLTSLMLIDELRFAMALAGWGPVDLCTGAEILARQHADWEP